MFNIICLILFAISCVILFCDLIITSKNKKLKEDFESLKEWCAETGNDPLKFIEFFENLRKEVNKK